MILIKDVTATDLARMFLKELKEASSMGIPTFYHYETAAQSVLDQLQVKADRT